ncbi:MAG: fumarate hydratase [Spirochaetes bacterium]|nr:fumarate hydratase [Spirochaetota bacterium]
MTPSFLRSLLESLAAERDDDEVIEYRKLDAPPVTTERFRGRDIVVVNAPAIETLLREAATDANLLYRRGYLERLGRAVRAEGRTERGRFVLESLLENAAAAAETGLPLCQDTGTACVYGFRGDAIFVEPGPGAVGFLADDHDAVSAGVLTAYRKGGFRASQVAPVDIFSERNTGTNLPVPFESFSVPGNEYRFLLVVRGGGSSNKTALFQETKAVLTDAGLEDFLRRAIGSLGVSACPPYRIAVAIGGQGPEETALAAKLASAGFLDALPDTATADGSALRSRDWERKAISIAEGTGWGAQFGGERMALDARVVRLTRHAASCPVVVAVSCAAHRQVRARIGRDGVFLERLERDPRSLGTGSAAAPPALPGGAPLVTLSGDLAADAAALSRYPVGTMLRLSGTVAFARDAAHARLAALLSAGDPPPAWATSHPIMYAGPTEPRPGFPVGAFGPTTSRRMDRYLEPFMSRGVSLVSIGKGERAKACADACARYGGCYLAAVGGAAALAGRDFALSSRVVAWVELGMEAVRLVEVRELPVLVAVDSRGTDFYAGLPKI